LEVGFIDFSDHNFTWWGTIHGAFKVPVIVFKMIWQLILEKILAEHGAICFGISPNS
jgi:hypothetical protein